MIWPSDILQVGALLVVSAGLAGLAILLAHRLGLQRLWTPPIQTRSIESTIATLASLADDARAGGVLSVESRAAEIDLPCLNRGVYLLARGSSGHEIRSQLLADLDVAGCGIGRPADWVSPVILAVAGLLGLVASAGAALWLATTGRAELVPILMAAAAMPAGIALCGTFRCVGLTSQSVAAYTLNGLMVIEAVCLMAAGRDGKAVQSHLRQLLPRRETRQAAAA